MENKNMEIFNCVMNTPKQALKPITGGKLKGFSDINPMYRIQTLTETFGPCGFGWKYTITNKEIIDGANETKVAVVDVDLYVKWEGEWSEAIPGTGASMLVSIDRNGKSVNDDMYKMALTDALSVACKAIGIGADVYWADGYTKYSTPGYGHIPTTAQNAPQQPIAPPTTDTPPQQQNLAQSAQKLLSPRKQLMQLLQARNIDVQQYMAANNLSKDTPEEEILRMIHELEQLPPPPQIA